MALSATIHKAEIHIADMNRHYYENHHLTIAQHPSETERRLMLRILAFILNANESLQFSKGLSTDDEPDLWVKNFSDDIELWIDLGQPSEKRIRKACGRSKQVLIYSYGDNVSETWIKQIENKLQRFDNLAIFHIDDISAAKIELFLKRSMNLQCNIQDADISISDSENISNISIQQLYPAN
ncbi:MAG: YaeQ family protein [Cellvibrionaceae bacterium]